jgi:hypothetical protein
MYKHTYSAKIHFSHLYSSRTLWQADKMTFKPNFTVKKAWLDPPLFRARKISNIIPLYVRMRADIPWEIRWDFLKAELLCQSCHIMMVIIVITMILHTSKIININIDIFTIDFHVIWDIYRYIYIYAYNIYICIYIYISNLYLSHDVFHEVGVKELPYTPQGRPLHLIIEGHFKVW